MPTLLSANYDYDCIIIVAVVSWIIVLFYYCTVLFMLMLMMMMLNKAISYHIFLNVSMYVCHAITKSQREQMAGPKKCQI